MPEFASICCSKREFFVDSRDRSQKRRVGKPAFWYLFVCALWPGSYTLWSSRINTLGPPERLGFQFLAGSISLSLSSWLMSLSLL